MGDQSSLTLKRFQILVAWHSHPGADHQHHGDALFEQVHSAGLQNLRDYSVVSEVEDLSDSGPTFRIACLVVNSRILAGWSAPQNGL